MLFPLLAAHAAETRHDVLETVGWRKDGTAFLYVEHQEAPPEEIGDAGSVGEVLQLGVAQPARGEPAFYRVKYEAKPGSTGELAKRYATAGDAAAWTATTAGAFRQCQASRDGVTVAVRTNQPEVEVSFQDGRFEASLGLDDPEAVTTVVLQSRGLEWRVLSDTWQSAVYTSSRRHYVDACFSPDGRQVAVVAGATHDAWMRGTISGDDLVRILPTGIPVQVLAAPGDVPDARRDQLARGLPASFAAVFVGPAQKARPASVVFADPKHDVVARELAATIPGGATVEPLTWKVDGALMVVALGTSAR